MSPRSATGTSRMSRWWSIMYVSKLYDASRMARGAKREPPRKEQVLSYGTPKRAMRASSYVASASAKRGAAIGDRNLASPIRERAPSLGRQLPAAQSLHVHDLLARLKLPLVLLGDWQLEGLVRGEVHQLRHVSVHREDLRLPFVDNRDADLVGHGVD